MILQSYTNKVFTAFKRLGVCLCAFAVLAAGIIGTNGVFRAAANESAAKKMLCFENAGVQSGFGIHLKVEKDVTYRIAFKYKLESGAFADSNGAGITLRMYNGAFNGTVATTYNGGSYALSSASGYHVYTAELTPNTSGWVYPMLLANSGGTNAAKLYVADLTVCRADDTSEENLATGIADFQTLEGWYFKGSTASLSGTAFTSADGKSTLTVLEYDDACFKAPSKNMVTVKNTGGQNGIAVAAGMTAGKTYRVSFYYRLGATSRWDADNKGNGGITVRMYTSAAMNVLGVANYSAGCSYETSDSSGWNVYTATLKPTENINGGRLAVILNSGREAQEITLANMVMYEESDSAKTDLLGLDAYASDLTGWYCKSTKELLNGQTEFSADKMTVSLLPYDESLFRGAPSPKMLHITTDGSGINLSQQLPGGLPGNTMYAFSVKYKIVAGGFTFKVYNGGFWGAKSYTVDTAEREAEYCERTFTYTGDAGPIIGLSIPAASELYLTDWSFYRVEDTEKTNLLSATSAADSLAGWMTGSNGNITQFSGTVFTGNGYTVQLDEKDDRLFRYTAPSVEEHKMLYIEGTPKVKYKHLGQNVQLTAGKSYTIAFKAKYLKGDIGSAFNLSVMNSWFGKTYFIDNDTGEKALPKTTVDGWNAYEYRFTAPETAEYAVGFTFVLTCRFYLADFSLYEDADAERVNLLPAKSVTSDLSGWRSDTAKDLSSRTAFIQEDNAYSVSLLPYDESLFRLDTSHKMLHINDYGGDAFFGQNVQLKKGVSYTIAFQYRFLKGDIGSGVHIAVQPQLGSGKYRAYHSTQFSDCRAFTAEQVRDDYVTYTFTLEDRSYEGGSYTVNEQDTYGIGLHFSRSVELYLADFVLYETDDAQKTNLLPVKNYGNGLYGWRSDWSTAAGDAQTFTDNGNKYTVELLAYLASAFEEPPEVVGPHKMIYFQNFSDYHVVCQRIRLKVGSTYRFSVSLASTVQARAMLQHNGARNNVFGNLKPIEDPVVHGDYFTEVFEFTVPAYVGETPVNTNEMYLGIQFPAATSAYIFDA